MLREYLEKHEGGDWERLEAEFAQRKELLERMADMAGVEARAGWSMLLAGGLILTHMIMMLVAESVAGVCLSAYFVVAIPLMLLGLLIIARRLTYWLPGFLWTIVTLAWCVLLLLVSLAPQFEDQGRAFQEILLIVVLLTFALDSFALGELFKMREKHA